ncbi:acyl-CoA thioesterase [Bacillus massilinigeriensis]|uniref:acyl-CoA thioesterase n=1 Tax=Bacillus mediterraneensis TaxID=1805474 RepID=UPI0008F8B905|nr:thioesterase family protein [Bacillus mediterraneensis]
MIISTKEIEVRYAETDQMGVVYHANYLVWMELGRTSLIEKLGFNYAEMEKEGVLSPVIDIQVSYKKPVRYGEKAIVKTWVSEYNGIKVVYGYEIVNESGEVSLTASSSHVCVKKENFQPISMRKAYPDWHDAYNRAKAPVGDC